MLRFPTIFILFLLATLFWACETEYIPDIPNDEPQIVVEGYIEAGVNARPPYLFLTRTTPFFSSLDANTLNDLFVHDATATISDGTTTFSLTEICYNDLDSTQQALVGESLGFGSDSVGLNVCVYIEASLSPTLGEIGKT